MENGGTGHTDVIRVDPRFLPFDTQALYLVAARPSTLDRNGLFHPTPNLGPFSCVYGNRTQHPSDPMRSTLRSLAFGLAVTSAGATMAQYPYTVVVMGNVTNCYAGQYVTIQTTQNTEPSYDFEVPVDTTTCTFTVGFGVSSNPAFFTVSTMCNGMVVTVPGQAAFNFIQDSMIVSITLDCGGGGNVYDCNNVLNGPDMPGTPCDDGNPMTTDDAWSLDCVCGGDSMNTGCQAMFTVGSSQPWTITTTNGSTGAAPLSYEWWLPDGSQSSAAEPGYTFTTAGVYGICLTITDANACSSWYCDTLVVDSNGIISNIPVWYDCLGVMYGNAVAGTPCTTFLGLSGEWNADCVCIPDSMNTGDDCLGIPNGPNVPGTPCIVPGTTLDGLWNTDCVCVPDDPMPCQADFWVMQAMGQDSLPVPYELWIWNLSSGGSGNFQYFWDFGDGTNSTEAFPTHTYSGNGPYTLCLTIADNQNCTSTHCDSISINGDGIYEGMMVHDEVRQEGFTINVQNGAPSAVPDVTITNNLALWPNPVADELNIAIAGGMKGMVTVTVTDMDGRTVSAEGMTLAGGRGQLRIATGNLPSGMYMLRISNGSTNLSQRFVKTN